ncbi:MAG: fused DSP-PTPase phosphatase/NAD kinase-like protein [Phycisphaerales bacterium]
MTTRSRQVDGVNRTKRMNTTTPTTDPSIGRRAWREVGRAARVSVWIVVGLAAWRGANCVLGANDGTVFPDKAYRSGQLSADELREAVAVRGVRSVVNLRGENDTAWYREEAAACRAAGVPLFDIAMSARELPKPEAALELARVLRDAPRPMLIHCKNGANRTGLAATIYLIECEGMPPDDAQRRGLTLWHGHIPLGQTGAINRFLEMFKEQARGKSLERWLQEDYPGLYADATGSRRAPARP